MTCVLSCGEALRRRATHTDVARARQFFERRGIEVREQEVFPGRPNVIARLPGRDPSRCVILEAHTDTVSVQGMSIEFFIGLSSS